MTDEIDLDELDTDSADADEPDANRGDWFWRGEGDPDDEPDDPWGVDESTEEGTEGANDRTDGDREETVGPWGDRDDGDDGERDGDETGESDEDRGHAPAPHVPRSDADGPVGVPIEQGGAGGGTAGGRGGVGVGADDDAAGETEPADTTLAHESADTTGADDTEPSARPRGGGPHGGGVDDMTMALTYDAVKRLANPASVAAAAEAWADWIGIVGDVPAHVINKLQREEGIDADFFSGAGQGPVERLRDVDENSMFYAERMVVVGDDGDEEIADAADWEFVHIETAAEKAGWDLSDSS